MKRRAKKFLFVFTITTIFFILSTSVVMAESHYVESNVHQTDLHQILLEEYGAEFVYNYFNSILQLENILSSFYMTADGYILYPDTFGGVYINDNGILVMLFTTETQEDLSPYLYSNNIDSDTNNNIITRRVQHSYSDLWYIMNFLTNIERELATSNVHSWSLDVIGNRIIVALAEYSERHIDHFKNTIINSPLIEFTLSYGLACTDMPLSESNISYIMPPYTAPYYEEPPYITSYEQFTPSNVRIRTGDIIRIYSNSRRIGWGSAGYRVRRISDNRVGLITAFHLANGLNNGDEIRNGSNQRIGTARNSSIWGDDATFIELNNNVTVDTLAQFVPRLGSNVVGNRVTSRGAASGVRSGTILSAWRGHLTNGLFVEGFQASYRTAGGDSGGVVYSFTGNITFINGITVARVLNPNSDGIFTPADSINRNLRVNLH